MKQLSELSKDKQSIDPDHFEANNRPVTWAWCKAYQYLGKYGNFPAFSRRIYLSIPYVIYYLFSEESIKKDEKIYNFLGLYFTLHAMVKKFDPRIKTDILYGHCKISFETDLNLRLTNLLSTTKHSCKLFNIIM